MPSLPIKKLFVPVSLLAMVVGSFMPTTGGVGEAYQTAIQPPANVWRTVIAPASAAFNLLTTALRDTDDRALEIQKLQALYEQIAGDAEFWRLRNELARLRRENAALQELSTRFAEQNYAFRLVSVVGRRFEHSTHTFTLSYGSRHGIREGQIIVAGPNLLGRITRVGRSTATAQLISTPGTRINTIIAPANWSRTGLTAQRMQTRQFDADGPDRMVSLVPEDAPVNVGDIAYLRDEFDWPIEAQGLAVGRVIEVESVHEPPLRKRVVIRPLRPYKFVDRVTVVVTNQTLDEGDVEVVP